MSSVVHDQIRGTMFGQAIGDALGLGAEFMSRQDVQRHYPEGLRDYSQIIQDRHRRRWRPGDWTDDTEQMICILDSLLKSGRVDVEDIAIHLNRWRVQGGIGIGQTVQVVMEQPCFLFEPHRAAREIWEKCGRDIAANGAVMRTSVLGVWEYDEPEKVRSNAETVCKVTHYDPRCVVSCVGVCHAISALLRGEDDLDLLLDEIGRIIQSYDSRVREYFDIARHGSLEAMLLDDEETMGYTLKALGAGLWALRHAKNFEEGLLAVVNEGGDADSNGAVAGAILGARFGFARIPERWIQGLSWRRLLNELTNQLIIRVQK